MIISAIAAVAENGTIGRDSDLPWSLPDDMRYFQTMTRGHHVITGRKNYETIPAKYRPLKDRVNIVVTRSPDHQAPGAVVAGSLEDALEVARAGGEEEVFIIGGGQIYAEALRKGLVDRLYLTEVDLEVAGDTHFPTVSPGEWREVGREVHPRGERDSASFTLRILDRA